MVHVENRWGPGELWMERTSVGVPNKTTDRFVGFKSTLSPSVTLEPEKVQEEIDKYASRQNESVGAQLQWKKTDSIQFGETTTFMKRDRCAETEHNKSAKQTRHYQHVEHRPSEKPSETSPCRTCEHERHLVKTLANKLKKKKCALPVLVTTTPQLESHPHSPVHIGFLWHCVRHFSLFSVQLTEAVAKN